jgi:hypothetical protein
LQGGGGRVNAGLGVGADAAYLGLGGALFGQCAI